MLIQELQALCADVSQDDGLIEDTFWTITAAAPKDTDQALEVIKRSNRGNLCMRLRKQVTPRHTESAK